MSVRKKIPMLVDGHSRKRGRLMKTWMEVIRIELKKFNLSYDLA